jgi:hypothetical protein
MSNSESLLQMTFVSTCRTLYPTLVMNLSLNGISLNGLTPIQKSQLITQAKREGMENGVQDLSIYLPESQILNLEFKRPKGGKQSPDQVVIESKLKELGHNYYLVRTPKHCFELIAKYTSVEFRQSQFDALVIPSSNGVLTKKFLYFTKGTKVEFVEAQLKEYYFI